MIKNRKLYRINRASKQKQIEIGIKKRKLKIENF